MQSVVPTKEPSGCYVDTSIANYLPWQSSNDPVGLELLAFMIGYQTFFNQ